MKFNAEKSRLLCGAALAGLLLSGATAFAADPPRAPSDDQTDSRWYVSLFGGAAFDDDPDLEIPFGGGAAYIFTPHTDTGYVVGITGGYRITPHLRGELEFAYTRHSFDTTTLALTIGGLTVAAVPLAVPGKTTSQAVLANLWYDFDLGTAFAPYIGGGIGFARSSVEFTGGATAKDTGFAYQIGAGVVVPVTGRLSIDVGYRFNGVENLSDAPGGGLPFNWDLRTHSVRAAAVLNF